MACSTRSPISPTFSIQIGKIGQNVFSMRAIALGPNIVPLVPDVHRAFMMNPNKPVAESGIVPDSFAAAPLAMGMFYHPIIFKSLILACIPTMWANRQALALKKIAHPSAPKHMRDVLEAPNTPNFGTTP